MLVFLANQFIGKEIATGGDILFIEILKRLPNKCIVIAPSQIHSTIQSYSSRIDLIDSDSGKQGGSASNILGGIATVWRYLIRTYTTYRWLRNNSNESTVIYLTGDFICNTLPLLLMKINGVKCEKVCTNFFHRNPLPKERPGNPYWVSLASRWLQGIGLSILRQTAQNIFVLSEIGKNELLAEGFDSKKIVVSGAGINADISKYRSQKRMINRFIFIGRLNITKGAFDLIEILAILARSNSHFECIFIGHGSDSDKQRMATMAEQSGLKDHIIIKGFVEEEEKLRLLATSTALLFPSKEEGYGIAVHEALYLGIPVVCYNLDVLKSLFGRSHIINFVHQNNQSEFASTLVRLLSESIKETGQFTEQETPYLQTWDDVFAIQSRYLNLR